MSLERAVAIATRYKSKSKASKNSTIVCGYHNDDGELIYIHASKISENGIKLDTWYIHIG